MAFPSQAKLSAIVQLATLNRKGLVADCLFPQVKTDCKFSYIDWENERNGNLLYNDILGCKDDVKEVDPTAFTLKTASLQDYGLSQALSECCLTSCGNDAQYNQQVAAGKTRQLLNKLLIAREKRAIDLALLTSAYTDNTTLKPQDSSAVIDGGKFNLDSDDAENSAFKLLQYFQAINEKSKVGKRNTMVTDLATLNMLLRHPDFIGSGCVVEPQTTPAKVASLLGLSKICIADADYNNGTEATPVHTKLWTPGQILFTNSYEFVTSEDQQLAFGLSAYNRGFQQYNWIDPKKGPQEGLLMQKQTHDFTEVVLSRKAATLVNVFVD